LKFYSIEGSEEVRAKGEIKALPDKNSPLRTTQYTGRLIFLREGSTHAIT